MDYKSRAKITNLEQELQRLRELLKDNDIDFAPLSHLDHNDYWGFYLTIYVKTDDTYYTRITKWHPLLKNKYLKRGDINSYGWKCKYILQCRIPRQ